MQFCSALESKAWNFAVHRNSKQEILQCIINLSMKFCSALESEAWNFAVHWNSK